MEKMFELVVACMVEELAGHVEVEARRDRVKRGVDVLAELEEAVRAFVSADKALQEKMKEAVFVDDVFDREELVRVREGLSVDFMCEKKRPLWA
jgi:hypothetical protein